MIDTVQIKNELDINAIRRQFPVLNREVKGNSLVYLDNAATSQKPQVVIDELVKYYQEYNANIHRGIHTLAEEATAAFENTRDAVQEFIHAVSREEIIFTRGTTESINLLQLPGVEKISVRGMSSSSPLWSIIPILFPGKCSVKKKGLLLKLFQ